MAEALLTKKTPEQIAAEYKATQTATAAPLSRAAFIDPATGAERPINNAVTNPQNYQKDVATGRANAEVNRKIDAIAHDTTLDPATKASQMKALFSTKVAPVGITPEVRQQIVAERDLPQNQYVPIRDMAAEAKAAQKYGLDPNSPEDVLSGLKTTYTQPQLGQMITNGEVDTSAFKAQDLIDLGLTKERIQTLMDGTTDPAAKARLQGLYQQVLQTGQMGQQVESTLNATPKPTNNMMSVLSEALNAKSNFKQQRLGTSDLFKQAGLSGYSVLAQSMNQRMDEMRDKVKSAQSLVAESGGAMKSTYEAIADNYNKILEQYDKQTKMLLDIDKQARDHEQALDLARQQDDLEKKTYEWKKQIDAQYDTGGGKTEPKYDSDGNFLGYWDESTRTFVQQSSDNTPIPGTENTPSNWLTNLGGDAKKVVSDVFYRPQKSDYGWGVNKAECGEGYNDLTDGARVGSYYKDKMKAVDPSIKDPQVGNGLVLPLKIGGTLKYGHIETVIATDRSQNPNDPTITTVSWNRDGKGTRTVETYKLSELQKKYAGQDWGFTPSKLKPNVAKKIDAANAPAAQTETTGGGGFEISPSGAMIPVMPTGKQVPVVNKIDKLYNALSTATQKLEARDPKSTMRKRFDKLTPAEQDAFIQDMEALKKDSAREI